MIIQFKSKKAFRGFCKGLFNPLYDVLVFINQHLGFIPVITSTYRPEDANLNPPGIHSVLLLRAIDIRSRGYNARDLCDAINREFVYDPTRPEKMVAILHDSGRGEHTHLQVHTNTRRR